jgi:hypothetical protein
VSRDDPHVLTFWGEESRSAQTCQMKYCGGNREEPREQELLFPSCQVPVASTRKCGKSSSLRHSHRMERGNQGSVTKSQKFPTTIESGCSGLLSHWSIGLALVYQLGTWPRPNATTTAPLFTSGPTGGRLMSHTGEALQVALSLGWCVTLFSGPRAIHRAGNSKNTMI